mmetsp:Transcript_8723/g.22726  ORF Transcript_8723/g.22726 Transcript_8723/m.22726 type:complete len:265 (+) Transcript_8723:192-986(+)
MGAVPGGAGRGGHAGFGQRPGALGGSLLLLLLPPPRAPRAGGRALLLLLGRDGRGGRRLAADDQGLHDPCQERRPPPRLWRHDRPVGHHQRPHGPPLVPAGAAGPRGARGAADEVPLGLEGLHTALDAVQPLPVHPQRRQHPFACILVLAGRHRVPPPRAAEAVAGVAGLGADRGDAARLLLVVDLVSNLVELQPHQPVLGCRAGAVLVVGILRKQLREGSEDGEVAVGGVLLGEDVLDVVGELCACREEGPRHLDRTALFVRV